MKKIVLLLLLISTVGIAQELKWETDLQVAIKQSVEQKKPLLLFFTGSDWCGWCIRLQKEVLTKEEFKTWAKDKFILVELDFPRNKPMDEKLKIQNNQIAQALEVRGYPTIHLVNPILLENNKINLNSFGKLGYEWGGPEKWIEKANVFLEKK